MKKLVTSAVLAAATMASVPAMAELSANAALTTNYMWRGATQSTDDIAVQGGADWANESGLYAGVWASTLGDNPGNEVDLYVGKKLGAMGPIADVDAGVIILTNTDDLLGAGDAIELKLAGSVAVVNAELYVSLDAPANTSYTYLTANTEFDVSGITVTPYLGTAGGDASGTHFGVSAGKEISGFDISALIDIADKNSSGTGADETKVSITASKGFDL